MFITPQRGQSSQTHYRIEMASRKGSIEQALSFSIVFP
uniref:Uncharacterized protein n=1 Tax=Arundo donax TaxID=35708 RepID=A0A0A9G919_ARUDO